MGKRRRLTDEDLEVIARSFIQAPKQLDPARWDSLEDLVTRPDLFGLTTASPMQRLICRILDGRNVEDLLALDPLPNRDAYPPEVRERATWEWMLKGSRAAELPKRPPIEFFLAAGIRGAKSLIIAAHKVHASQRVKLVGLRHGEPVRYSTLSIALDKARAILQHLVPTVTARPALARLMVGEPRAQGVTLRHPSGGQVDLLIVAGARAGGAVVAYWSAGIAFDEATRMLGRAEGTINMEETREAVLGRLLPGAQLLAMGSPWAPMGPVYQAVVDHHGKPTEDLVVLRAPAPAMNPHKWTPEEVEKVKRQAGAEQTYQADVLGEFVDAETGLFAHHAVERARRKLSEDVPPDVGWIYLAAIDPATRRNAWTLTIVGVNVATGEIVQVLARQWQGTPANPLNVRRTCAECAELCAGYGLWEAWTDQWAADPIRELAADVGLVLHEDKRSSSEKDQTYLDAAALIETEQLELHPDPDVAGDLKRVRKLARREGGFQVVLPLTADGRHCDHAAVLARAVGRAYASGGATMFLRAMQRVQDDREAEERKQMEAQRG